MNHSHQTTRQKSTPTFGMEPGPDVVYLLAMSRFRSLASSFEGVGTKLWSRQELIRHRVLQKPIAWGKRRSWLAALR